MRRVNFLSDNPVYVQSSTRPGALVSVGEQVHGTFSFNTETPLSVAYQPPAQANGTWLLYSDPVNYKNPIDAVFQNSGLHTTVPAGVKVNSTVQVADNATTFNNGDVFSLINSASYKGEIFTNNILLGDSSGAVFNSAAIPEALNFSQFNYGSYGFSRMSVDGLWVEVDGAGAGGSRAFHLPDAGRRRLAAGLARQGARRIADCGNIRLAVE